MNILPKKRWHVRTKANIERVRRDEAKAAEEEKEKQRRIQLAEQEARTDFLRQKARVANPHKKEEPVTSTAVSHVNLFQAVEEGQKSWGTNKEHELEKKEEQEEYEKKIGLLTYLGQDSVESQTNKPWWISAPDRTKESADDKNEIGEKSKSFLDPLVDMKRFLGPEHFVKAEKKKKTEDKPKKHKKHKKDKLSSSGKSIDELRRERLRREREERLKSEKLLNKLKGTDKNDLNQRDGYQAYNSQFNPHLARQSRKN